MFVVACRQPPRLIVGQGFSDSCQASSERSMKLVTKLDSLTALALQQSQVGCRVVEPIVRHEAQASRNTCQSLISTVEKSTKHQHNAASKLKRSISDKRTAFGSDLQPVRVVRPKQQAAQQNRRQKLSSWPRWNSRHQLRCKTHSAAILDSKSQITS